ncbi:hypothetical protein ACFRCG_29435 [Embleya sp. NPDC056575]|uniref:hypothetical protein n=1 Tax=unclassified Embleya TaxID=2699296 RepID=UPI00369C637A
MQGGSVPRRDLEAAPRELEVMLGWEENPVLYWQSTSGRPSDRFLPGLHRVDGLRAHLRQQDSLRGGSGFNFTFVFSDPKPYEGGLLLADSRRALSIDAEGTVTAAAVATEEMLCWSMGTNFGSPTRMDVVALSELTLECFRFVDRFVLPTIPGTWQHHIVADRFTGTASSTRRRRQPGPCRVRHAERRERHALAAVLDGRHRPRTRRLRGPGQDLRPLRSRRLDQPLHPRRPTDTDALRTAFRH